MFDTFFQTELVEGMQPPALDLLREREFNSVICLNDLRLIAEINDRPSDTVHRIIGDLFPIRIDEPLARGFVNDGILIKVFVFENTARRALSRYALNVKLPLLADMFGRIIRLGLIGFPLRLVFIKTAAPQIPIERDRITAVSIVLPQFAVQLIQSDIRVASDKIGNVFLFFFGLCVRMQPVRTVRSIRKAFKRTVI